MEKAKLTHPVILPDEGMNTNACVCVGGVRDCGGAVCCSLLSLHDAITQQT